VQIENIVFDFGGVLVDWNPRHLYAEEFQDHNEMEYFLKSVCSPEWNSRQDAGRSFSDGILELEKHYPNYSNMIRKYFTEWHRMLKDEISENVDVLLQVQKKQQYNLYGLTNWSTETMPIARQRFSFFDIFIGIVISGEEKMIKPDKNIYRLLLDRYSIEAKHSLFIDDSFANVQTALEMGFHALHYHRDLNLESEFQRLGIL
jgi:2-haloacid dehalogenase